MKATLYQILYRTSLYSMMAIAGLSLMTGLFWRYASRIRPEVSVLGFKIVLLVGAVLFFLALILFLFFRKKYKHISEEERNGE